MVPPEVLARLHAFAAAVDRAAPGTLAGLYTVGSVALGDYRARLSNLDVLAVADRPWAGASLGAARRAARGLDRPRQPARVAYLTWEDLGTDPAGVDAPCYRGRSQVAASELANPLTWQILRTAAVCTRGPEYPDLWSGDVRPWATARLTGQWSAWLETAPHRPGALLLRPITTETVLEVARLQMAVRTGRVVSKLEAGTAFTEGGRSRVQRIMKDATGYRRGVRTSMYWGPFERRNDTVLFVRLATDEAADVAPPANRGADQGSDRFGPGQNGP